MIESLRRATFFVALLLCALATRVATGAVVQRCERRVEARDLQATVSLGLEGGAVDDWPRHCQTLLAYLRPPPPPYDEKTVETSERLLLAPGFFSEARCRVEDGGHRLACTVRPARMVRSVAIEGEIPFTLLKDDLKRRIFLRPGTVLEEEAEVLARQRKRLEDYLRRKGYFGSTVRIRAERTDGAEPNAGVRLVAKVKKGRTVALRRLRVRGRNPIPTTELVGFLEHNWLLWFLPEPFQPERFEEDQRAIAAYLQSLGYPEAQVTARWEVDPAAGAVDVTLQIDPGPKLDMKVRGNAALDTQLLLAKATFYETGVVDSVAIEETLAAMRAAYQEAGFYAPQIEAEVEEPD